MKKLVIFVIGLLLLVSCERRPQKIMLQGLVQGSYYAITYYDDEGRNFQKEVDSIFHAVDLSVNLWVDSSVICKVNRNEEVVLDQIFIDNFNIAQGAAALSGGYFDPTISPLVSAWGFSKNTSDLSPLTSHLIDSLKELVDYRKVRIEEGRLIKDNPAMKLDFNAIAQGYTTDLVGALLDAKGVKSFIVDIGGEVFARGTKPDGKPWVVGIEKPAADWDSERVVQQRVELEDKGIVTSGSYRKYVERDGKRYSHCIDPNTGYPVQHNLLSATVIAENATWADALASICMVMGMERSLELVKTLDGVEAYYIFVNDNNELETFATEGFQIMD
ncbi:MAG: FAD:protein FMN transferase [Bacteroidales bacterium]|nr:FAD:protein FMN transferase [Bacteroidales bacterium]